MRSRFGRESSEAGLPNPRRRNTVKFGALQLLCACTVLVGVLLLVIYYMAGSATVEADRYSRDLAQREQRHRPQEPQSMQQRAEPQLVRVEQEVVPQAAAQRPMALGNNHDHLPARSFEFPKATDMFGEASNKGHVCIIVRTYAGHAVSGLNRLIASLQDQTYADFSALFVDTDIHPWPEGVPLAQQLRLVKDPRFRATRARATDAYSHLRSYYLTDAAIRECPEASRWLLITNGDNTYSPKFLDTIDPSFDITASPFFSRYWYQDVVEWIAVESSCDMLSKSLFTLQNRLQTHLTDLGANVLSLSKFLAENRLYSQLVLRELNEWATADGKMLEALVEAGWSVKKLHYPMFSHSPNQWEECLRSGANSVGMIRARFSRRDEMRATAHCLSNTDLQLLGECLHPPKQLATLNRKWEPTTFACYDFTLPPDVGERLLLNCSAAGLQRECIQNNLYGACFLGEKFEHRLSKLAAPK